jgi:hypothetical protein
MRLLSFIFPFLDLSLVWSRQRWRACKGKAGLTLLPQSQAKSNSTHLMCGAGDLERSRRRIYGRCQSRPKRSANPTSNLNGMHRRGRWAHTSARRRIGWVPGQNTQTNLPEVSSSRNLARPNLLRKLVKFRPRECESVGSAGVSLLAPETAPGSVRSTLLKSNGVSRQLRFLVRPLSPVAAWSRQGHLPQPGWMGGRR